MKTYLLETKYEFLKALRNPSFALPTILFPIIFYYMFGIVFGWKQTGNVKMAEYLLATYGAFGVIGAALFGFGVTVAIERGHGWMEAKRTTPMPIAAYFVAKMFVAMLFSAIVVLLLFALGTLLGGVTLPFLKGLMLFLTLIAGSVTFCALGLAVGFIAGPSAAAPIVNVIYLPMGFLSGLWIPIQFLPDSVKTIAQFLPPYHYSQLALKVIGASRGESVAYHVMAMLVAAAPLNSANTMGRLIPHDNDLGWTPFAWLIYIVPFTLTPLFYAPHNDARHWTIYGIATAVFLALYFRGYWVRGRELVVVASAIVAMGIALWPVSHGAGAFFIYGASFLGQLEPQKRAVRGVLAVALIAVVEAALLRRDLFTSSWPVVFVLIVGGINIHYAQVGRANARLRIAREEIEHLAKLAERERIARDLHDLLGHTLSLVILKSELASKLADRDPERARDEIRDVERIAREALAEVRSAVTGYRSGGLQAELQHARNALSTAGVAFECDTTKTKLPPAHEAVLCLALREAVTNIVRHAGARRCRASIAVENEICTLTISDDGRGGNAPFGSGLTGMRERVEVLGGSLTRDGRRGTTLTVTLPLAMASTQERSA